MGTREDILRRLRENDMPHVEMPKMDFEPLRFDNAVEAFSRAVESVGGSVAVFEEEFEALLAREREATGCIISNVDGVAADINPDMVADYHALGGRYTAVLEARMGVAENGAVWVPQQTRHKAPLFAAERLIVLLNRSAIVATMQDAFAAEAFERDFMHGCFVSGPSKTADIEQALVIGAHGAMGLTVVLR